LGALLQAVWGSHAVWQEPLLPEHRPSLEERARWAGKTREARGYVVEHRTVRTRYEALVASGLASCAR
jgi:hypothetical protein